VIRIVTDSSSDLPAEIAASLGIDVVPLTIRFGDEEFVDRVELSAADFWTRLVTSPELPETAAPSAGAFEDAFRSASDGGADGVVAVTLSSQLSGTYQSAVIAADRLDFPVRVIDSATVGVGLGLIGMAAAVAGADTADVDAVARAALDSGRRTGVLAALDTLEYLKRGGRIGAAQAFLGSLLEVKPLITIEEGVVGAAGRVRTRSKALSALEETVRDLAPRLEALAIFHGGAADLDSVVDRLATAGAIEPIVTVLGAVVGTHTGPGVIGVAWRTG
jgi:DegV family protein with EDD domain